MLSVYPTMTAVCRSAAAPLLACAGVSATAAHAAVVHYLVAAATKVASTGGALHKAEPRPDLASQDASRRRLAALAARGRKLRTFLISEPAPSQILKL